MIQRKVSENDPFGFCNRCKIEIDFETAECCWWCMEYLCPECWDEYGHCGHVMANLINLQAREVEQPQKMNRAISQLAREREKENVVKALRTEERPFKPKDDENRKFDENGRLKF